MDLKNMLIIYSRLISIMALVVLTLSLTGCGSNRIKPGTEHEICSVFDQNYHWYRIVARSEKRWGTPKEVIMAIMHQESRYQSTVKPPRHYIFGFIPWGRKSSAYGFAQVKLGTWDMYKKASGNTIARRDDFDDAADFVGWYTREAHKKAKIPLYDARKLYLAYHEGINGFIRGTYRRKPWLQKVADKVANQAWRYKKQLAKCEHKYSRRRYLWG